MAKTKGFEVAEDRSFPALAMPEMKSPEALRAALDAVGGVDRFIQTGDR